MWVPWTKKCRKRDFFPTTCSRHSTRLFRRGNTHATCIRLCRANSQRDPFLVAWGSLCTTRRRKTKKRILYSCSVVFNSPSKHLPLVSLSEKTWKPARKKGKEDGGAKRSHGKSRRPIKFWFAFWNFPYLFSQRVGLPKPAIGRVGILNRKMRKTGLSSHDTHASLNATLSEGKYARHLLTLVVAWGPLCTTCRRKAKKRTLYLCSIVFDLPP